MIAYLASMDTAFICTLLLVCGVALWTRLPVLAGVSAIVTANWFACTLAAYWAYDLNQPYSRRFWAGYLVADYLSAMCVTIGQSGRIGWRVLVGLCYTAMLVVHAAYAMGDGSQWATYQYDQMLSSIAWVQLLVLFMWGLYELAGRPFGITGRFSRRMARVRDDRQ